MEENPKFKPSGFEEYFFFLELSSIKNSEYFVINLESYFLNYCPLLSKCYLKMVGWVCQIFLKRLESCSTIVPATLVTIFSKNNGETTEMFSKTKHFK